MSLKDKHAWPRFTENWGAPPGAFLEVHLLPRKIMATALRRRTVAEVMANNREVNKGGEMKKQLSALSFAMIGVGTIVATGIFSFLPYVYVKVAGPSVVLSIVLAAGTAALSAFCYSEFASDYPVTGGGFFYTMLVFGELPASLCAINLLIDYVFGTAAVVRNLSAYFSMLFVDKLANSRHCGKVLAYDDEGLPTKYAGACNMFQYAPLNPSFFCRTGVVDYVAAVATIFFGLACAYSTKLFDHSNVAIQILHIALVVVTLLAAFSNKQSTGQNFHPFFPQSDYDYAEHTKAIGGSSSTMVITGAANIFFIFVGYDVIALGAEEGKHPTSMPYGTVGSIGIVTVLYILMACGLIMLIPYYELAARPGDTIVAAFAYAFEVKGMHWARYIVALGAVIGICTSTAIGIYGMSRVIVTFSRERLFPPWLGAVNSYTGTPVYATLFSTVVVMFFAFFSDFATLANLTSIGTLVMFWFVALALIYRRYAPGLADELGISDGGRQQAVPFRPDPFKSLGQSGKRRLVGFWMTLMTLSPIVFTVFFNGGYAGISAQPLVFNLGGYDDSGKYTGVKTWWPALVDQTRSAVLIAMTVIWFASTLALQLTCPMEFVPERWGISFYLVPWLPSASIFSITLLVGAFGGLELDYSRLGYCVVAMVGIYVLYGVHASYARFEAGDLQAAEAEKAAGKSQALEEAAEDSPALSPAGAPAGGPSREEARN